MQFDNIISPGDDCFISPFDSYNVEWNITSSQFMKGNVQNFCRFAHFGTYQDQCTTAKFPPLAYPAHFDGIYYIFGGQHFRINQ